MRSPEGDAATRLILATFRVNGRLVAAGDELGAGQDLTSARWQVLGAVALAERPLTVPQIARRMGLTRQSVHATVKRLSDDGAVELAPNGDHRRSALVRLTAAGAARYEAIDQEQAEWVDALAAGIIPAELERATAVLEELGERLERGAEAQTGHGGPRS